MSEPTHQEKPQKPSYLVRRMNEPMLDVATCLSASAERAWWRPIQNSSLLLQSYMGTAERDKSVGEANAGNTECALYPGWAAHSEMHLVTPSDSEAGSREVPNT